MSYNLLTHPLYHNYDPVTISHDLSSLSHDQKKRWLSKLLIVCLATVTVSEAVKPSNGGAIKLSGLKGI